MDVIILLIVLITLLGALMLFASIVGGAVSKLTGDSHNPYAEQLIALERDRKEILAAAAEAHAIGRRMDLRRNHIPRPLPDVRAPRTQSPAGSGR